MIVAVICGIPGCGKSYLCKTLQDSLQSNILDVNCFSFDDYQIQSDLWNDSTFKASRLQALNVLEKLIDSQMLPLSSEIGDVLDNEIRQRNTRIQRLVLVDDIMYLRSMRKQIYSICKRRGILMCVVWLKSTLEIALYQNLQRPANQHIDKNTIKKIYNDFQPPINHKVTHDRHCMIIDRTNINTSDRFSSIEKEINQLTDFFNSLWQEYDTLLATLQMNMEKDETVSAITKDVNSSVSCNQSLDLLFRKISSAIMKHISQHLLPYVHQQKSFDNNNNGISRDPIIESQQLKSQSSSSSTASRFSYQHDIKLLQTVIAQSLSEAKSTSLTVCKQLRLNQVNSKSNVDNSVNQDGGVSVTCTASNDNTFTNEMITFKHHFLEHLQQHLNSSFGINNKQDHYQVSADIFQSEQQKDLIGWVSEVFDDVMSSSKTSIG